MSDTCIYCGLPATLLCDFVIGFTDPDGDDLFSFDDGSEILRCDAPLCEAHASHQGNMFVSGEDPFVESIDHCIGHDKGDYFQPVSEQRAAQIRHRHRFLSGNGLAEVIG